MRTGQEKRCGRHAHLSAKCHERSKERTGHLLSEGQTEDRDGGAGVWEGIERRGELFIVQETASLTIWFTLCVLAQPSAEATKGEGATHHMRGRSGTVQC